MTFHAIDGVFLSIYFVAIMGIGFGSSPTVRNYVRKIFKLPIKEEEKRTTETYFLASRDAAWWAVGK